MSTNPFRRSSLKGSGGSNNFDSDTQRDVVHRSLEEITPEALSITTKPPGSSQKHVNFASPPAVPISPVSYPPSSPESLRISPAFAAAQPILPNATDYSEAIQSDPFHAEAGTDEDDGAIQQALQNARANIAIVARDPQQEKEEAVRRTLSKFASAPRKPPGTKNDNHTTATTHRQTMDVDAFKRLLMTGDSGQEGLERAGAQESTSSVPGMTQESISDEDSSSSGDYDVPGGSKAALTERTDMVNRANRLATKASYPAAEEQSRTKPPPPKSRHGKSITDKTTASTIEPTKRPSSTRTSSNSSVGMPFATPDGTGNTKKAPPPPLSRKKSHKAATISDTTAQPVTAVDQERCAVSNDNTSRAVPPPPPTRRPHSMIVRHPHSDLTTTVEESNPLDLSTLPGQKPSGVNPTLTGATGKSSSKRMSMGALHPPPVPPPRRGRESSRSSIDSQRPSLTTLAGNVGSTRSSGEYTRTEQSDTSIPASASNATDILADLAALQQEVDEARRGVSR